ncbi:hypothetical protein BT69DRAFT_1282672 [Atractiella rhizophila]|nr:hypothetical protein BT69DRAFT_1282672 [Atractiella rhizophila]
MLLEVLAFLHTLASVLTEYFKELEVEAVGDNFVIIYELLDVMMDFGYPQTIESKSCKNTSRRNRTSSRSNKFRCRLA